MSTSASFAERFRSQRTDRIRVDEHEVLSLVEFRVSNPLIVELAVEERRDDHQVFVISCSDDDVIGLDTASVLGGEARIDIDCADVVELHVLPPVGGTTLRLWNAWDLVGVEQAWTGNSGIIAEELETPENARARMRFWCSDGLGDPSFDDLVMVMTTAELDSSVATERREAHVLALASTALGSDEEE